LGQNTLPEKTTDAPSYEVGELMPQPHGGAIRNGGTNKGGSGRPSHAQIIRYETLLKDEIGAKYLEEVAQGLHGAKAFLNLHHAMVDRVVGAVPKAIEVTGNPERPLEVVIRRELPDR
jgi:hypothetical protein